MPSTALNALENILDYFLLVSYRKNGEDATLHTFNLLSIECMKNVRVNPLWLVHGYLQNARRPSKVSTSQRNEGVFQDQLSLCHCKIALLTFGSILIVPFKSAFSKGVGFVVVVFLKNGRTALGAWSYLPLKKAEKKAWNQWQKNPAPSCCAYFLWPFHTAFTYN